MRRRRITVVREGGYVHMTLERHQSLAEQIARPDVGTSFSQLMSDQFNLLFTATGAAQRC